MNYVGIYIRTHACFFVLEQGQLSEQDLYFFYLFIIIFLAITMGVYACARVCVILCGGGRRLYRASSVSGRECNRSTNSAREQDVDDGAGEMVVVGDGK